MTSRQSLAKPAYHLPVKARGSRATYCIVLLIGLPFVAPRGEKVTSLCMGLMMDDLSMEKRDSVEMAPRCSQGRYVTYIYGSVKTTSIVTCMQGCL